MPEEAYWETLFDVPLILDRLGIDARLRNVVEFGCGYGTFTIPAAKRISGVLTTFDIDEAMIERTRERAAAGGAYNVVYVVRDVFAGGFGGAAGASRGRGAGDSLALRSGDAARAEPGDPAEAGADWGVGKGNSVAGCRGAGD